MCCHIVPIFPQVSCMVKFWRADRRMVDESPLRYAMGVTAQSLAHQRATAAVVWRPDDGPRRCGPFAAVPDLVCAAVCGPKSVRMRGMPCESPSGLLMMLHFRLRLTRSTRTPPSPPPLHRRSKRALLLPTNGFVVACCFYWRAVEFCWLCSPPLSIVVLSDWHAPPVFLQLGVYLPQVRPNIVVRVKMPRRVVIDALRNGVYAGFLHGLTHGRWCS